MPGHANVTLRVIGKIIKPRRRNTAVIRISYVDPRLWKLVASNPINDREREIYIERERTWEADIVQKKTPSPDTIRKRESPPPLGTSLDEDQAAN